MEEIFKDIKGYEGLYQVSNKGGVKRLPRKINNGRGCWTRGEDVCKSTLSNEGYMTVYLTNALGVRQFWRVHRLVAVAFLDNPNNHPVVNHIDGIKDNNNVENLEWCTISHNVLHAMDNGLLNSRKPVVGIHIITLEKVRYNSILEASKLEGLVSHSSIEEYLSDNCKKNMLSICDKIWFFECDYSEDKLYEKLRLTKVVQQIDKYGSIIKEHTSIQNAGDYVGIDRSGISKAISGVQKSAGGFKWKLKWE